jgi:uncharacterized protein (DUF488 family)
MDVQLFTIGFTHKRAEDFFTKLRDACVERVADVRLNNTSQLAGFAKKDDLAYFLRELANIEYIHLPELAPTQELLDSYKKQKGRWAAYEEGFVSLMKERRIEDTIDRSLLHRACLLCSEHEPEHCHRRLIAEYLKSQWGAVQIVHLI